MKKNLKRTIYLEIKTLKKNLEKSDFGLIINTVSSTQRRRKVVVVLF